MIFAVAESIALRDDFGRTPMQLDVNTVFSARAERAETGPSLRMHRVRLCCIEAEIFK
jgi:hypothetical protein